MAEDPGRPQQQVDSAEGLSDRLELLERAPSEHAKAVIVNENLVPWIQKKGRTHQLTPVGQLLPLHLLLFAFLALFVSLANVLRLSSFDNINNTRFYHSEICGISITSTSQRGTSIA